MFCLCFPYLYYKSDTYDSFLTEEPLFQNKTFLHFQNKTFLHFQNKTFLRDTFFTLFVLCHPCNNTTLRNIGETDAWAVSTSNFGGTVPPKSPPMDCAHL